MVVIFDLDQTLVDTRSLEPLRNKRDWKSIYPLIPNVIPYAGINRILEFVKEKGIKTAIVTKSPRPYCEKFIADHGWKFDATVCYHDCKNQKPHPEPILKALELLGEIPERTISIGDDPRDVEASKRAGVISVAAFWGSKDSKSLSLSQPDYSFKSVEELDEFLRKFFDQPN